MARLAPVILLLVLAAAAPHPAGAASFDCAKAASPSERAICADPGLSAQDSQLAAGYAAVRARLSAVGRAGLTDDQRGWLRFVQDYCRHAGAAGKPLHACLDERYRGRIFELGRGVRAVDGYRVATRHSYGADSVIDADRPQNSHAIRIEHSWDEIDDPQSDLARRANDRLRALAAGGRPWEDWDLDVEAILQSIGADLVNTVLRTVATAPEGWPRHQAIEQHPYLPAVARELAAADLFRPGADWRRLLDRQLDSLVDDPGQLAPYRDDIAAASRWVPGPDHLTVRLQPWEWDGFSSDVRDVAIPWRLLAPVLDPRSPYPPARAAARR